MELLVGPTFSIEVSSSTPAAAAFVVPNSSSQDNHHRRIFLKEDEVGGSGISSRIGSVIGINNVPEESSDSSSSIGAPDDSEEEEEGGEEVERAGLSKVSLDSLEESLPIKRGLSNHFTGKSKSFANLSEVSCVRTVKDLEKPENPFNKRRRLLLASKWCRKSSFYSWANPKSMPLLTLNEDEENDIPEPQQDTDDNEELEDNYRATPSSSSSEQDVLRNHHQQKLSKLQDKKFKASFKSRSCFSLTDMQDQPFQ